MNFLTSGKVKDLYDVDENTLLFKFSNRVSAYDVKFKQDIPKKGEVLCHFAEFWFDKLDVPNHFVKRESETEISVKKMKMIPMECVVRGYFYGSLISRWENGSVKLPENTDTRMAAKLTEPFFDPTTKSEHDIPVDKTKALEMNLVSKEQFSWLEKTSLTSINKWPKLLMMLVLFLDSDRIWNMCKIVLGDSIGPDEYRLWPKETYEIGKIQESYDKQILRDWLTANGYQKQFENDRNIGKDPIAPEIPSEIIQTITQRYVIAYEKLTGLSL